MIRALDMPKEISDKPNKITVLAPRRALKEINPAQGELDLEVEKDIGGIGMGVLSDGTPYLNQRGLAVLCGVQNAHIGTISSQWSEPDQKPRITAIKSILAKANATATRISRSRTAAASTTAIQRKSASQSWNITPSTLALTASHKRETTFGYSRARSCGR